MSTGTLTVHALLDALIDLEDLHWFEATDAQIVYVDDPADPALRIVLLTGTGTFRIEDGAGNTLYAQSDYTVTAAAFAAALTTQGAAAALSLLVADLATLALPEDGDAGLVTIAPGSRSRATISAPPSRSTTTQPR